MAYDMDDQAECPLCMEQFEMDDLSFFPCTCGYQICRFCWHRIRTDENGLCPACRKPYSENPADFKPLTNEELQKIKAEKKQKDLQKKLKMSENKKHLANVRVVQKNLVFVVGLSPRLSDPEVLKRHEYFGKFGKIHKVVINHSTQYVGTQCRHVSQPGGPSASAYVTYYRSDDALRAIAAVNNVTIENRTLKASLGTTKYCSHFMKNQPCPKTDCMYLHEPGDEAASFTKEAMQQGKHQEYEKKLHDQLFQQSQNQINRVKDRRGHSSQSESGSVPIPSGSRGLGSAENSPPDAGSATGGSAGANGSWPLLPQAKKSRGRKSRKRNAENAAAAAARTAAAVTASSAGGGSGAGSGGSGSAVTVVNNQSDDDTSTGSRERQTDSSRSTPLAVASAATPPPEPPVQAAATPPPPPTPPAPAPERAAEEPEPSAQPPPVSDPPSPPPAAAPSPAPAPAPVPVPIPAVTTVPSPAIATLTPPPGLSHPTPASTPASSAGSAEWLMPAGRSDSLAAALLSQPTPPPEADECPLDGGADDLDFDPFEETEKGLSALLEREREQQQARAAAVQRHHQALRLGAGTGHHPAHPPPPPAPGLSSFNVRARLPPPGFSGPSGLGLGPLGHPPQQQPAPDLVGSKMLSFLSGGGGGLNGLSRPPPPPGRPRALSPHDSLFSDLSSMMMVGGQSQMPPHSQHQQQQQQQQRHDSLKDWQGLKKHFPNINISFSSGVPPSAGGLGRFPPSQQPGSAARHPGHHAQAPPLARFMAQPPKPPTSSQGWMSGAGSDWTAMDPAIVSSGQLAGPAPRSDSPPHWLRSLEQLTETGPMYPPAAPQRAAPALWTSTPPPGFNPTL